jgi:multiple sugar transport system substrate-binding protein
MGIKQYSRREFLRVGGMAAAATALAACATPTPQVVEKVVTQVVEKQVTTIVEKPVTKAGAVLRYMGWPFGNWMQVFEQITTSFYQKTGINVTFEMGQSTATREKVAAMVAAGNPPDLAMGFYLQLIPLGKLLDCTPFIDRDKAEFSWDNYFNFSKLQARRNPKTAAQEDTGGTYIFPLSLYAAAAYYNKDLFDAAGLSYPTDDWTWDQYREAASKLTIDVNGKRVGEAGFDPMKIKAYGANHWNWNYMYTQMVWERGSDVMTSDASKCAMRDQAWVDTFNWIDEAVNKLYAHPGGAMSGTGQSGGVDFMTGTVAIDFGMNWSVGSYIRDIKDFKWAMAAMPYQNGKRIPVALNDGIVIFKDSKYPEEAWNFMKYFQSEDVSRDYISQEVAPPFKKVCLEKYIPQTADYHSDALKIGLEEGRPMPDDRTWDDWAGVMDQALGAFTSRQKYDTAAKALDWAATEIDRVRGSV